MSDTHEGRSLTDRLLRWGSRRSEDASVSPPQTLATKVLPKFLKSISRRESPVILDLGPVVGANVSFLGDRLGCKIFVEDLLSDLERFTKDRRVAEFAGHLEARLPHPEGSVDGVLCWDVFDYLDKRSAQALGRRLTSVLKPGGALLGFFATVPNPAKAYTRHVIVNDATIEHRPFSGSVARQPVMVNRDIARLFDGLRVVESFLLLTKTREMLFRKIPTTA